MIPLTTLYDDHSDWPKVTEKNPFEYIVPLPLRWVETKIKREALYKALNHKKCNKYQLGPNFTEIHFQAGISEFTLF